VSRRATSKTPHADTRRSLDAAEDVSPTCHGCSTPFAIDTPAARAAAVSSENVSPTGRYACEACGEHFCIECDTFVHETLHVCPGCA
jgi:transcription initiation factor TFIIH subunit 2